MLIGPSEGGIERRGVEEEMLRMSEAAGLERVLREAFQRKPKSTETSLTSLKMDRRCIRHGNLRGKKNLATQGRSCCVPQ